ncbi:MAG: DUF1549 domain-containing protein [Planctomycetes bacterium]|nr:DUF1549 domain-containing protein [Planctomycetota bacterium]
MNRVLVLVVAGALLPRIAVAGDAVDFVAQIKPILSARCYACHSALRQQSGLRLDTAAMLIIGGDSGAAVEPGKSADSLVVQYITGEAGVRMPPEDEGAPLSDAQIAIIKKWIDEGARAPDEPTPPDPRDHWAYQPPVRADVPTVENAAWVRHPVDAFLAADHESRGLAPARAADKAVLLRRVYFDLVGLPPTRDELAAFLADESPDAYEKVVDRLLASPQYGERWARHWMDVWRYSDWSGYKEEIRDSARHIWRWRDWIVESLNADKGYDRMLEEMLAGDEIAPIDPNTLRATGFLVRNWHKFNRNTWLEGTIEHTAKAFLGVTMNCCRCHDHKYDPISQSEYFQFRAIFEPHDVRTDRVPGEADPLKDGLPRVCDMKPEAPTFLLERGNELRPDKSQSLPPGVPKAFGSELKIAPIELPIAAYYPAMQEFAIQEDLAKAALQITNAEAALTKAQADAEAAQKKHADLTSGVANGAEDGPARESAVKTLDAAVVAAELASKQLETARGAHASLTARIAAEKAKFGLSLGADVEKLASAAGKAQRQLTLLQAQEMQIVATQELSRANTALKTEDAVTRDAVTAAEKKVADAATALAAAHAALAVPTGEYQPLGVESPRTSTGRRLALARWITDRKNPLAARVAVNHIWLRHFGSPLVDNTFDFGLRSPQSRNQPLLDWLAIELMDHGWQMKHIHRLLVTSSAYRMKSATSDTLAGNIEIDRDNKFLWRMNPRRMEAEAVRDALFYTAGNLDLTRGGPDLACDLAPKTPRRSLYFRHAYEKQAKFLELFDGASVNECYRRSESVVPQQALALANNDTSRDQSRVVARKLSELASKDSEPDQAFVQLAFEQILGRKPSAAEVGECGTFLLSQAELLQKPDQLTTFAGGAKTSVEASSDPVQRAREDLTLVLFNHNDFVTIR